VELTPVQHDALIELLNIGFGRAAASLSELTGHRVLLEVPHVSIHPIGELNKALEVVLSDEVASVHQIFSGPVAGDALLILDHHAAGMLKELLTNEPALPRDVRQHPARAGLVLGPASRSRHAAAGHAVAARQP